MFSTAEYMFSTAEYMFSTAEYTFSTAEYTFSTAEYNTNACYIEISTGNEKQYQQAIRDNNNKYHKRKTTGIW